MSLAMCHLQRIVSFILSYEGQSKSNETEFIIQKEKNSSAITSHSPFNIVPFQFNRSSPPVGQLHDADQATVCDKGLHAVRPRFNSSRVLNLDPRSGSLIFGKASKSQGLKSGE